MYLVKNKDSGVIEPIGSMTAIANHTGLKVSKLYQQFSRNKKTVVEVENWEIEKKTMIKSKRT